MKVDVVETCLTNYGHFEHRDNLNAFNQSPVPGKWDHITANLRLYKDYFYYPEILLPCDCYKYGNYHVEK